MNEIKNLLYNCGKLELSSSVFRGLHSDNPTLVIWKDNSDINITDLGEYGFRKYYDNSVTKLYETTDRQIIESIYEATAYSYIYNQEERVAMLLNVIDSNCHKLR